MDRKLTRRRSVSLKQTESWLTGESNNNDTDARPDKQREKRNCVARKSIGAFATHQPLQTVPLARGFIVVYNQKSISCRLRVCEDEDFRYVVVEFRGANGQLDNMSWHEVLILFFCWSIVICYGRRVWRDSVWVVLATPQTVAGEWKWDAMERRKIDFSIN